LRLCRFPLPKWIATATIAALVLVGLATSHESPAGPAQPPQAALARVTIAGGCFWCMDPFDQLKGVVKVRSGYTGGHTRDPSYEEVSAGSSGQRLTSRGRVLRMCQNPSAEPVRGERACRPRSRPFRARRIGLDGRESCFSGRLRNVDLEGRSLTPVLSTDAASRTLTV
jgi:hypothetical protein